MLLKSICRVFLCLCAIIYVSQGPMSTCPLHSALRMSLPYPHSLIHPSFISPKIATVSQLVVSLSFLSSVSLCCSSSNLFLTQEHHLWHQMAQFAGVFVFQYVRVLRFIQEIRNSEMQGLPLGRNRHNFDTPPQRRRREVLSIFLSISLSLRDSWVTAGNTGYGVRQFLQRVLSFIWYVCVCVHAYIFLFANASV